MSIKARAVILIILFVAAILGGIFGYCMHRRVLNLCDDIIRQVEGL